MSRLPARTNSWWTPWMAATSCRGPGRRRLKGPGWLRILDTRFGSLECTEFSGPEATAYEYCGDTYRSFGSVARHLGGLGRKTSPVR
jgi:hypothetical protein